MSTPSSSAKPSTSKSTDAHNAIDSNTDEPVPSYDTALREGAGGGIGAAPRDSATPAQSTVPIYPTYGCSPYTSHGTTRILIVPALHTHHPQQSPSLQPGQPHNQNLLPMPASMQAPTVQRAKPRFFLALLHGIIIYILINLLVDVTVTRHW